MTLKSISRSGLDEREIYKFPHATRAIISPSMEWIAFREYHRSYVTPFEYFGTPISISAEDNLGFTQRVDKKHDGDFMSWSSDSNSLLWTRGKYHYEKSLNAIIEKKSKLTKNDISFTYDIDKPATTIVFKNLRVLTMNKDKDISEGVSILVRNNKIIFIM